MAAQGLIRATFATFAALVADGATLAAAAQDAPLLAPTSQPVVNISGPWEIAASGAARACRVLLSPRETANRRMAFGAPPACRLAIPALAAAAQWAFGEDGRIRVYKSDGAPLMMFRRERESRFLQEGGDLVLEPVGGREAEAPRAQSVAATLQALAGETPARDAARAALVGRYALGRDRGGAGCDIDLKRIPGPRPKKGGAVWAAALDADCRDEGLRTFDPVGWQFDDGRIFLVARKGHAIGFSAAANGEWTKDPAQGRPLWMKRK